MHIHIYIPQELMWLTEEKNVSDICLIGEPYEINFKGNINTSLLLYCSFLIVCHSRINRHWAVLELMWSNI